MCLGIASLIGLSLHIMERAILHQQVQWLGYKYLQLKASVLKFNVYPFAEPEYVLDLCVFYGCMQDSITNASQDCADVLTRVPTGTNAHSCVEGIKMHIQWALDLSKLLHIGRGWLQYPNQKKSVIEMQNTTR